MSKDLEEDCCYVRATCNYQYPHKGKDVTMVKDEVYLLIRRTTDEWWQVSINFSIIIHRYLISSTNFINLKLEP